MGSLAQRDRRDLTPPAVPPNELISQFREESVRLARRSAMLLVHTNERKSMKQLPFYLFI